jgi:hypothetical protein
VSAVITLAIVVMWAVVLVPMWVRRHDRVSELASVDRFAGAMRVLSRRTSGRADRRYVLMPERPARADAVQASVKVAPPVGRTGLGGWRRASLPHDEESVGAGRTVRPAGRRVVSATVRRRRRTLAVLVALVLVSGLAIVVRGASLLWLQLLCDLLLVAGLARTRSMVAAERRREVARAARMRRATALRGRLADIPPAGRGPGRSARTRTGATGAPDSPDLVEDGEDIVVFTSNTPRPQAETLLASAEELAAAGVGRSWVASGPAPTPESERPPRPSRMPMGSTGGAADPSEADTGEIPAVRVGGAPPTRVLDLTRPGYWAEGRLIEDDPEAVAKASDVGDETDLDRIIGRRRAVND